MFRRNRNGGRRVNPFAVVPIPRLISGAEETRSLIENLYGTEAERSAPGTNPLELMQEPAFGNIEAVEIRANGVRLKGRFYYPAPGVRRDRSTFAALFCSGSAGSAETYGEEIARYYLQQGVRFLAVNYRGFGGSTGTPSEAGLYEDVEAMHDFILGKNFPYGRIIIHGYSMGGPVAAHLAMTLAQRGRTCAGLVLESPMPSAPDAAADDQREGVDGLAATVTRSVLGTFDTVEKLRLLAGSSPNLPIRLVSGQSIADDHLDISKRLCNPPKELSFLDEVTAMRFRNIEHVRARADHFQSRLHMEAVGPLLQPLLALR